MWFLCPDVLKRKTTMHCSKRLRLQRGLEDVLIKTYRRKPHQKILQIYLRMVMIIMILLQVNPIIKWGTLPNGCMYPGKWLDLAYKRNVGLCAGSYCTTAEVGIFWIRTNRGLCSHWCNNSVFHHLIACDILTLPWNQIWNILITFYTGWLLYFDRLLFGVREKW